MPSVSINDCHRAAQGCVAVVCGAGGGGAHRQVAQGGVCSHAWRLSSTVLPWARLVSVTRCVARLGALWVALTAESRYCASCTTAVGARSALCLAHDGNCHAGASRCGGVRPGYRWAHARVPNALARVSCHCPLGPPPAWLEMPRRGSHVAACPAEAGRCAAERSTRMSMRGWMSGANVRPRGRLSIGTNNTPRRKQRR